MTRRVAYSTSFITRDSNRLASGLLESQNGPCSATHSSTQPQRQLTRSVLANQEIRESTAGQATDPTSILHPVQLHDNLHMAYQARAYPIPQQSFQCQQQHQQHQFEQQTQSYTTAGNIRLVYPVSTPNTIALFQPIETNLSGGHLVSTAKNDLFYNQQQMNASFSGEPVTTNLPGPLGLPPLHLMPTVGVVPSYPSTFYSFPIYPSSLLQVQPNQQALLPRPPVFLYQQARQRPQLPQAPTAPLLPPPPPPPQPPAQQPIILQAPVKMPGPAPAPLLHVPQPFQAQSRGDPRSVVLSTQPFRPQIRLLQPRYLNDLGAQYGSSDGNCGGVGNTLTSPGQFVYAQNRVHFQMGRKTRLRKTHSSSTHALPAQRANLLPSSLLKQCQSHTEQFSQYPLQSAGSMMITPTLQPIPGRLEPGSSSPETLSTQSASTDQWFHQFQCPKFAPGLSGGQNCQLLSLSPLEQMNNTFGCFLQMPNSEGSEYLYNLVPSQQNRLSESDGYALSGHIEPTTTIPPIPNDPSREASLFCCQNIANHHAMIRSAGAPCNYNLIGPTSAVLPSAHSITSGAASLETNLSSEVSRAADSFQSASDKYFNSFSLPAHEIQLPEALPVFCPASASYESGCMDKTALILPFPPDVGIRPDCAAPGKAFTTSNYWSALSSSTVVPCPLTYPWPSSVNSLTYNDCKNLFPLDEVKPACETNLLANHKSEEEFKAFQETLRQSTCQGAAKGFDQLMADHFAVTTVASAVCDENLELFSDQFAEPQSNRELDTSNGVSSPFSGCPIGARPAELGLSPAARSVSLSCSSGADSLSSHINSLEDIMAQLAVNTKAFSPLETVR
ncbi:unnamed protein product [Protopolystoma xenopodis]|uniref:Uncharacterized protein n=1 Tax=Protopolystoma xenopodis TaxID=117903 RepID=A0A3S5CN93_9PLAT|nr:unnamed protein product [Protopolystoma xenopodis]